MGLFHDDCEAIIDLKTGRALSGEDLRIAQGLIFPKGASIPLTGDAKSETLAAHGWGVCGHSVSKKARVCSKCGSLAPKGYVKCPSCREWVGNESKFCPHCNHPLHPEERIDFAGGVWDRKPGVFAQRFELDDVSQIVKGGLKIQEGTLAVLLDAGKKVAVLGPGRHRPEGTLRSINWFGNPPPRSVIMVDAGDCLFRMFFSGMRSAEELPLNVVAEVTLRFDADRADEFLANVFKSGRTLTMGDATQRHVVVGETPKIPDFGATNGVADLTICASEAQSNQITHDMISSLIVSEATAAVRDLCQQSTIEDLIADPDRRPRFQDAIGRALKDLFQRSGLELIRVGYVEFVSPAYEKFRAANAGLEVKRRELEFNRKLRDFELSSRDFRNERERDTAEDNLAMREYRLSVTKRANVIRSDEEREAAEAEKAKLDGEAQKIREKERRRRDQEEYIAQLAQEHQLGDIARSTELAVARLAARNEESSKEAEVARNRQVEENEKEYDRLRHQLNKVYLEEEIERARAQACRDRELADAEQDNAIAGIKGRGRIEAAVVDAKVTDIQRETNRKDATFLDSTRRMDIDTDVYGKTKQQELSERSLKFMQELESKERLERAATIKGMTYAEMAAMADDPNERAQYLEMDRLQKQEDARRAEMASQVDQAKIQAQVQLAQVQGQTEALKAQAQAQAAAAAAQAQVAANDKTLEEVKKVMGDRAEHDERIMRMMQELAGKAIEKPTTVVNQPAPAQVVVPNAAPQPINIVK